MPHNQQLASSCLLVILLAMVSDQSIRQLEELSEIQRQLASPSRMWAIVLATLSVTAPLPRRCWREPRDFTHPYNILNGRRMQGRLFEETFRMTRLSFERLHAILGSHICY